MLNININVFSDIYSRGNPLRTVGKPGKGSKTWSLGSLAKKMSKEVSEN